MTTGIDYSVSQNMRFNDTIRINGSKYSRMDQVKFFKGCLTHISLGWFWIPWPKWKKVFKKGASTTCWRQPLKFLLRLSLLDKFYLLHSWILYPKWGAWLNWTSGAISNLPLPHAKVIIRGYPQISYVHYAHWWSVFFVFF